MTDRKQARAMDLPDYPCPPNLGGIPTHAGSWGWFNPATTISQDADGYLWVKSAERCQPTADTSIAPLAVWTEDGLALYLPRHAYHFVRSLDEPVDELLWTPVASVLREPPAFALNFGKD